MGAGGGLLVVPAGNWLVAYESRPGAPSYTCSATGSAPASSGGRVPGTTSPPVSGSNVTLAAKRRDIVFGQVATLRGTAPPGAQVQLVSDAFPFDRFAPRKSTTAAADGSFSFRVRPDRNTSFKAVAGGAESAAVVVYVELAGGIRGRPAANGRWRLSSLVLGPRDLPYRGKRLYFYAISKSGKSATRLGGRRLRGKRGTFRAVLVTPVRVRHYAVCVRERKPDAWGEPLVVDRICGARRMRF